MASQLYTTCDLGLATSPAFLQSYTSCRRNYSFGEKAITKCGGAPFGCAVFLNMEYGVSVLGAPLSVMTIPWAASKFKAASCYSVHPLILSATDIACWFPSGLGLGQNLPKWLTQVDSVPRQAAFNVQVQVHTHIRLEWQRNLPNIEDRVLRKEATYGFNRTGFTVTKVFITFCYHQAPCTILAWGDVWNAAGNKPWRSQFRSTSHAC